MQRCGCFVTLFLLCCLFIVGSAVEGTSLTLPQISLSSDTILLILAGIVIAGIVLLLLLTPLRFLFGALIRVLFSMGRGLFLGLITTLPKLNTWYKTRGKNSLIRLLRDQNSGSFRLNVKNQKLRNTINQLFKPEDKYPDGTAGSIRRELKSGNQVGNKSHLQKGKERIRNLENIIQNENLNDEDLRIAKHLLRQLEDVFNETRH